MRDYPYRLAPGQSVNVPVVARHIMLKSCSVDAAAMQVTVADKDGRVLAEVKIQQGEKIPGLIQKSASVLIENTSATETVDIVMVMGDSPFESDRTSGQVSITGVVETKPTETLSGDNKAFFAGVRIGAAATGYGYCVLWNKAANTKNLVIEQLTLENTAAITELFFKTINTEIKASLFETDLVTPVGEYPLIPTKAGGVNAANCYAARGVSTTQSLGGTADAVLLGDTRREMKLANPIIIPPGYGLKIESRAVNQSLSALFECYEAAL